VITHNGQVSAATRRWAAVLQVGRRAALDGVTALQAAGAALTDEDVHVITPKSSTPASLRGVIVHESRRFDAEDVLATSPPRMRPAVAAVHGALWARTDREATYLVLLAIQQRLCTSTEVAEVLEKVHRDARRSLLRSLVGEAASGVTALSELDVARDFRAYGLPEPERQVLRQREDGRDYLDCRLPEWAVVIELDGAGHDDPDQRLDDLVRDIRLAADGDQVIRIPMAAYRLDRQRVLKAIADLLRSKGWRPSAAA
jgi:hypothetical protein